MEALVSTSQKFSLKSCIPLLLTLTFLAFPLSSTGKSICLGAAIAAVLLTASYRQEITGLFSERWCQAAFLLFLIALLACLWSPASWAERLYVLEKYSKLLYFPILVIGFRDEKTRKNCLHAFLLAMVITSGLAVMRYRGFLPNLDINPDHVFRNHIMVGYMGDFASYISLLFFFRERGIKCWGYLLLFLLFSYHMLFVNGGRMGYITYVVLMVLLVFQFCSWRHAVAGILLLSVGFVFLYKQNEVMINRVHLAVQEIKGYQQDKNTPVGFRFQFYNYAKDVFARHPLLGNGTGSFTYYFRTEKPIPAWDKKLLEPHNQYWLIADEFGVLGLIAFLFFLFYLFKTSWQLHKMRAVALAMLIPFILGNLTDSLLLYSGSGYFFLLFMALCFSELSKDRPVLREGI